MIANLGCGRGENYSDRMFDVRRLVVLREVVRCGSLSAAAASLNYTTSAVSQQIAALERDVGAALLIRGPAGARPTPAGTRLLEHATTILAAIAAAERELADGAGTGLHRVRVTSFASAAAAILPQAFKHFRAARPQVGLQIVPADPDDGIELLEAGRAELAVITEVPGERPQYPGILSVPVYDDEFYVVLPAGHRLANAADVPLSALADEEWVVSSETGACPDTRVFRSACQRAGFTPAVTFRSEDYATVQGLVAANLGVSLVPSLAAASSRADVAVRRVSGHRPVRRIAVAMTEQPEAGSALAVLVSLVATVGARLNAAPAPAAVYSVPARPFSVA